ncbi:MAG: discoidin domain-containing protein [Anaerolineae bacterium]
MASDKPVIQGYCDGAPIYRLGHAWLLGEAPNLVEATPLQVGNSAPHIKVHPKRSSEIRSNRIGADTSRMPRTTANDYLPLEPIHLIDGNPQTCWSSRTQSRPDVQPIWIRLDLVREQPITRIVLRKRPSTLAIRPRVGSVLPEQGAVEVGRSMASRLTIRLSRDAWHWDTVFEGPSSVGLEDEEFSVSFAAQPAKQIWIIGEDLQRVENWLYAFSIGAVEAYDTEGRNVALASLGTGISVNSTMHSHGQELVAHRWYTPFFYYGGLKWARVGYHDDPINWHWVERQKGVLDLDKDADDYITELVQNGVHVTMALGFGNRLYSGDPTRNVPQLWEWYYENPEPPTTPEALEGWARYIRYMAERFKDRVTDFEVWNEWNGSVYWGAQPNVEQYLAVARTAIPILREVCPKARIAIGNWAGFPHGFSTWSPEQLAAKEEETLYLKATRELASEIDVVGWHPFYQADPDLPQVLSYTADVHALLAWLESVGFHGHCMVTEWNYGANYPPIDGTNWFGDFAPTEIQKAKYVARLHTQHTSLGLESIFCEMNNSVYSLDLSLLRRSFDADPLSPLQPQAAYYATRNLATALEELEPATWGFEVRTDRPLEAFAMQGPQDRVLALWFPGRAKDADAGTPLDVVVEGAWANVQGYDPLNGTLQALRPEPCEGGTLLRGVLVRDYPLLLRMR